MSTESGRDVESFSASARSHSTPRCSTLAALPARLFHSQSTVPIVTIGPHHTAPHSP